MAAFSLPWHWTKGQCKTSSRRYLRLYANQFKNLATEALCWTLYLIAGELLSHVNRKIYEAIKKATYFGLESFGELVAITLGGMPGVTPFTASSNFGGLDDGDLEGSGFFTIV